MGAVIVGILALAPGCVQQAEPDDRQLAAKVATPHTAFANDKLAYDYFRTHGFTNFQAAGIVGNLDQESGINPTISQQNGGPGRGIAQWSAGGRWDSDPGDNCVAFAAQENKSPSLLEVQLDFIMFELHTFPDYGLTKLLASTNLNDATTDFELDFEGCGIPSQCDLNARLGYAQDVFSAYGNDPVPTTDGGAADAAPTATADLAQASPSTDASLSSHDMRSASGGGPMESAAKGGGCALATGRAPSTNAASWTVTLGLALWLARRRLSRSR